MMRAEEFMLVVMVDIWVKEGTEQAFGDATRENVTHSRTEPGIAAFDLLVDPGDPAHFMLVEVYRDAAAPAAHKETAHYQRWRATVEAMMKRPRSSAKWETLDAGY
jgi:quinol monooxygenase YgiN